MHDWNEDKVTLVKEAYLARKKRVMDAISLKTPDRVPIVCLDEYFSLHQQGITPAQAYYHPDLASKAFVEQVVSMNWDMVSPFGFLPGKVGEILEIQPIKWAGFNLPDTQEFQYVEQEYMLADEYDLFFQDPSDFIVRKIWPRMAKSLKPLQLMPSIMAMSHSFAPISEIANFVALPDVREMLEKLIQAGEMMEGYNLALDGTTKALAEVGIPVVDGPYTQAPFDWISDYFRGIKGSMMDMFYQPDNLKAAIELMTQPLIDYAIQTAKETGEIVINIPLHRGADPFMSNEQFAEFYWPTLKELILALIEAELLPFPYWEGSYTSRLEFLAELPPGKVWGHFQTVDRKKAKEILGEVMCFWGNVSAQLLISGTSAQVREDVRELIDTFGDNGGLIIDGAIGIPKEAKLENVIAMTEAVFEYGVY
jgi:uroporphyrinogen-III decarboxylase